MHLKFIMALLVSIPVSVPLHAGVIVETQPDILYGKTAGAMSGLMIGSASGGPAGALVGVVIGYFAGGSVHAASGLHGVSYIVEKEGGEREVVRSPNRRFQVGDRVTITENKRLALK